MMKQIEHRRKASRRGKRLAVLLLAFLLLPAFFALGMHSAALSSTDPQVKGWFVTCDGTNITMTFSGEAGDSKWYMQREITVTYSDGSSDSVNLQFEPVNSKGTAKWNWNDMDGLGMSVYGQEGGTYDARVTIPVSLLGGKDFTMGFAGTTVASAEINGYASTPPEVTPSPEPTAEPSTDPTATPEASASPSPEPSEEPVYNGIVIDGQYQDWDAVKKYPAADKNLESVAMVFDGDMVYCYLKEAPGMSAAGAGPAGNGQFCITTDLGRKLVFQLRRDGTVNGIKGVEVRHVGDQWELSIPTSELPQYMDTISFGLYRTDSQSDIYVADVANLNGQGSGGTFNGIVYDGNYTDWDYYPHTEVEYATEGTSEEMADAMGALWVSDDTLFGHFVTEMPQHVWTYGHCMMSGINFQFSGKDFSVRLVQVDSGGKIIGTNPSAVVGTQQEFYLLNRDGWGVQYGQNINELPGNFVCGKITVTATSDKNECEFYLDLKTLGEELGCDFKEIKCQFIQLGDEWITIEGTPTGPLLGVALCVIAAAGAVICRKRKQEKTVL